MIAEARIAECAHGAARARVHMLWVKNHFQGAVDPSLFLGAQLELGSLMRTAPHTKCESAKCNARPLPWPSKSWWWAGSGTLHTSKAARMPVASLRIRQRTGLGVVDHSVMGPAGLNAQGGWNMSPGCLSPWLKRFLGTENFDTTRSSGLLADMDAAAWVGAGADGGKEGRPVAGARADDARRRAQAQAQAQARRRRWAHMQRPWVHAPHVQGRGQPRRRQGPIVPRPACSRRRLCCDIRRPAHHTCGGPSHTPHVGRPSLLRLVRPNRHMRSPGVGDTSRAARGPWQAAPRPRPGLLSRSALPGPALPSRADAWWRETRASRARAPQRTMGADSPHL